VVSHWAVLPLAFLIRRGPSGCLVQLYHPFLYLFCEDVPRPLPAPFLVSLCYHGASLLLCGHPADLFPRDETLLGVPDIGILEMEIDALFVHGHPVGALVHLWKHDPWQEVCCVPACFLHGPGAVAEEHEGRKIDQQEEDRKTAVRTKMKVLVTGVKISCHEDYKDDEQCQRQQKNEDKNLLPEKVGNVLPVLGPFQTRLRCDGLCAAASNIMRLADESSATKIGYLFV